MAQTIVPDVIGKLGGFDSDGFETTAFDQTTIATEVFSPQVGDAFQVITPDFIDGTRVAGFDIAGFDDGFDVNAITTVFGPTVASTGKSSEQQDTGAGSGGSRKEYAAIGGFIRWGRKKKKKKPEQVKEVVSAVMQTVRQLDKVDVKPSVFKAVEIDYTEVAERILADTNLLELRQQEFGTFLQKVERAIVELDDEEILLMVA